MTQKEEFQKQLDISKGAEIAKEAIKNGLKIEWETDLEKIDFSIFGYSKDKEHLRVEDVKLSEFPNRLSLFEEGLHGQMVMGDDASVAYFAFLVSKGVKVTPPLLGRYWERLNGGLLQRSDCGGSDGTHRTSFCRLLGYKSIPMVIEDVFCGYVFSVDKWLFDYRDNVISIIEKTGAKKYEIKRDEVTAYHALSGGKIRIMTYCRPLNASELYETK